MLLLQLQYICKHSIMCILMVSKLSHGINMLVPDVTFPISHFFYRLTKLYLPTAHLSIR